MRNELQGVAVRHRVDQHNLGRTPHAIAVRSADDERDSPQRFIEVAAQHHKPRRACARCANQYASRPDTIDTDEEVTAIAKTVAELET